MANLPSHLHVMFTLPCMFSPFNIGMVINHTRVLFQMREGYAALQRGGGFPIVGGGGGLMTHSAGSVTIQRIALKYVMSS
jgi:hypothetical protein